VEIEITLAELKSHLHFEITLAKIEITLARIEITLAEIEITLAEIETYAMIYW
jgi:hypothetical protein